MSKILAVNIFSNWTSRRLVNTSRLHGNPEKPFKKAGATSLWADPEGKSKIEALSSQEQHQIARAKTPLELAKVFNSHHEPTGLVFCRDNAVFVLGGEENLVAMDQDETFSQGVVVQRINK